jgi:alkanesulfonate monooxygenase SsuD/methylene tetrahydromethanopterin reductase-like flavin-dependent oxidoreductase (luciferase family)
MRKRVYEEQGLLLKADAEPAARNQVQHSILCGSPDTVCEAIAEIDRIGVGGLILVFRLGPMPAEVAEESIRLFMRKVAPRFRDRNAFAA